MSLDFPNRQDWLAYRTKIVKPPRYFFVSGYGLATRRKMVSKFEIPAGKTYEIGRNRAKRAKRSV